MAIIIYGPGQRPYFIAARIIIAVGLIALGWFIRGL